MNKNKISALFIFLFLTLTACSGSIHDKNANATSTETKVATPKPGSFGFAVNSGLSQKSVYQSASSSAPSSSITLNYGNIKTSKHFFVEIINSGDEAITSISVTVSRPDVLIQNAPSTLEGISEIVFKQSSQISIEHGKRVDGIGNADLLVPGSVTGDIQFVGFTTSGNESITVNGLISVIGEAKFTAFELSINGVTQNLNTPEGFSRTYNAGSTISDVDSLDGIKGFIARPGSTSRIKNTGNVDFILNFIFQNITKKLSFDLKPSESQELTPSYNRNYGRNIIQIDSEGTVADPASFQTGGDGRLYVVLQET